MDFRKSLQLYTRYAAHPMTNQLLYYLQLNNNDAVTRNLFDCTPFSPDRPYYYCQTGMEKKLYTGRIGIEGQIYSQLYHGVLEPALSSLLDTFPIAHAVYMIIDDSKELGVVFQPHEDCTISPLTIAEAIDRTVQQIYDRHLLPEGCGYCNTTALSEAVSGPFGVREGFLQTEQLKSVSFFRMLPGVLTREQVDRLKNNATYRDVTSQCRMLCRAVAQGRSADALIWARRLFLDLLKHSFDPVLVSDAFSCIKHFLSVRLAVYSPEQPVDLNALCALSSYVTIEECFEAVSSVLLQLCRTIEKAGSWSDAVAYAAYYLRINMARDVSLSEIAAYADATPAYLSSLFHQQTGLTIKQYQQKIRMEHACTLLTATKAPIGDIAAQSGFLDRRYFTKTFKSVYRMTPVQYREAFLAAQEDPSSCAAGSIPEQP